MYTSVLKGDVETFQKEINRLLRKTIICFEEKEHISFGNAGYTAKLVHRQALYAYHGFVVGVLSGIDGYIVKNVRF